MATPILVTGAAGFIGFHVARRLLAEGRTVVGVDSFSSYYDPRLKEARFARLSEFPGFTGLRFDLADALATRQLFDRHGFRTALHLAAQPGVRYALTNPEAYASANLTAFVNILEGCRHTRTEHLVYASSSSVYGANTKLPFSEADPVDQPISLYAATKRSNELMAHAYAHLFGLPCTGLRFFTVYGPWGRPDMAIYRFTDRIARGEPIEVAAGGEVRRDFTYVDDAVEAVIRVLAGSPPAPARQEMRGPDGSPVAPIRLLNIGGDRPSDLNRVVALIESELGRRAVRLTTALPPGDVVSTSSDASSFAALYGRVSPTSLEQGIASFVAWYRSYHEPGHIRASGSDPVPD
ncbi:NAD-dependent epimerase/dehydratase family protein [Enterovirga aerilata]|uniref:NAD-dependent epimerase/dehydratase family protein n=1 Tax=Enterovirga aerilata TaxID=2730920 RepID=A0A849IJH6_9HYPH|nr:NAD-dependent epimerase/dehydratase family protein [Enterovirga sp. DB1703]NNM74093.1 NAD-dependent epimerase/dehydratase family protein [Enterovirga sp. DB1703]